MSLVTVNAVFCGLFSVAYLSYGFIRIIEPLFNQNVHPSDHHWRSDFTPPEIDSGRNKCLILGLLFTNVAGCIIALMVYAPLLSAVLGNAVGGTLSLTLLCAQNILLSELLIQVEHRCLNERGVTEWLVTGTQNCLASISDRFFDGCQWCLSKVHDCIRYMEARQAPTLPLTTHDIQRSPAGQPSLWPRPWSGSANSGSELLTKAELNGLADGDEPSTFQPSPVFGVPKSPC